MADWLKGRQWDNKRSIERDKQTRKQAYSWTSKHNNRGANIQKGKQTGVKADR